MRLQLCTYGIRYCERRTHPTPAFSGDTSLWLRNSGILLRWVCPWTHLRGRFAAVHRLLTAPALRRRGLPDAALPAAAQTAKSGFPGLSSHT